MAKMKQARITPMKKPCMTGLGIAILLTLLATSQSKAEPVVTVPRICDNGVCGSSKYFGGRVRIKLLSQLSRTSHFNFKTNPGDQIELGTGGNYSFDHEPGDRGTYSAQACGRSGTFARSICTQWTTFDWRS
jgi:hypothetical protein